MKYIFCNQPSLWYSHNSNALRIVYPDGACEVMYLGTPYLEGTPKFQDSILNPIVASSAQLINSFLFRSYEFVSYL